MQRFEKNAAQSHGTDIPNLTTEFVQYVADNENHNICTLDGHDTFHGMGIIAAITPRTRSEQPIPRAKDELSWMYRTPSGLILAARNAGFNVCS